MSEQIGQIRISPSEVKYAEKSSVRVAYTSASDGRKDWAILTVPHGGKTWVVVLHGHGSSGEQLYEPGSVRNLWLEEFNRRGWGILCPNLRDNAWMSPKAVYDLHGLLGYVRATQKAGEFLFVSGSMGGTGSLIYAIRHPRDVGGIVALGAVADLAKYYDWCDRQEQDTPQEIGRAIRCSYGGTPQEKTQSYGAHCVLEHYHRLRMPVFLAHGQRDELMDIGSAKALAMKLSGRESFKFNFREIIDGDHNAPLSLASEGVRWMLDVRKTVSW